MTHWASGCEQCTGGEGPCTVGSPSTAAWDWLAQVNAANYAGHSDWRLPSESGCNSCYTAGAGGLFQCTACDAHELETILLSSYPCGISPCIDSIFGSTQPDVYWSASTYAAVPARAWYVYFSDGVVSSDDKTTDTLLVRAVRSGS
jgi:hypothetical protein